MGTCGRLHGAGTEGDEGRTEIRRHDIIAF